MSAIQKVFIGIDTEATGERIHALMKQKGLTIREVADAVSISSQSVWKWCKGQTVPSLDNMVILSKILETGIDDIVVKKENSATKNNSGSPQQKFWAVTSGSGKNAPGKKESNFFTICMASKNKLAGCTAE